MSNTGSAISATAPVGRARFVPDRRSSRSTAAEGTWTTSCSAIRGDLTLHRQRGERDGGGRREGQQPVAVGGLGRAGGRPCKAVRVVAPMPAKTKNRKTRKRAPINLAVAVQGGKVKSSPSKVALSLVSIVTIVSPMPVAGGTFTESL